MTEAPPITVFNKSTSRDPVRQSYITDFFERAGYQVKQVTDAPLPLTPGDFVLIQGNFNWFPRLARKLIDTPKAERPYVVLWHTEPLPLPSASTFPRPRPRFREIIKILLRDKRATDVYTNARRLRQVARHGLADLIIVSTPSRHEFLAEHGIESHWVPLGYNPTMGRDLGLRRDIDVLFIGTPDDPRHRKSVGDLRKRGLKVISMGSWTDPGCWGDRRTETINRAKVFLAIQRNLPGKLSGMRMILGMANKSLVISEPMYNSAPFVSGTHFVSATLETMPDTIRHYLANDAERERIAEVGHRFVMQELRMDQSISRILDMVEQTGGPMLRARPADTSNDQVERVTPDLPALPAVAQ